MPTITIRVDDETFQKLEEKRGDGSKSDFYREALLERLNTDKKEFLGIAKYVDEIESLKKENESLKAERTYQDNLKLLQDERIRDIQKQLGWMQLEYQKLSDRLLLPAPAKKWWEFWK